MIGSRPTDERSPHARENTPTRLVAAAARSVNVPERPHGGAGCPVTLHGRSNDDASRSITVRRRADEDAGGLVAVHGCSSDAPRRKDSARTHSVRLRAHARSPRTRARDGHGRSSAMSSAGRTIAICQETAGARRVASARGRGSIGEACRNNGQPTKNNCGPAAQHVDACRYDARALERRRRARGDGEEPRGSCAGSPENIRRPCRTLQGARIRTIGRPDSARCRRRNASRPDSDRSRSDSCRRRWLPTLCGREPNRREGLRSRSGSH
jgi:hypothetical protein